VRSACLAWISAAVSLLSVTPTYLAHAGQGVKSPKERAEERREAKAKAKSQGEAALAAARTLLDLTRLVGVVPDACEALTPESRVCSWEITNRMPGYALLAPIVDTSHRVYLICELPADNSERKDDSCTLSSPK